MIFMGGITVLRRPRQIVRVLARFEKHYVVEGRREQTKLQQRIRLQRMNTTLSREGDSSDVYNVLGFSNATDVREANLLRRMRRILWSGSVWYGGYHRHLTAPGVWQSY